ncbi:hypothetical protein SAMN05421509_11094 [Chromohalobacter canadensis]|uniref:Uncharacterized protein n=1 Tax=Chromohalobacter canadensis TaxID=141389 RepID=A0A285VUK3_9GAMM|nr:hypothetical protein SAMN05421509_11094 [Chromohalobacter canadensis]
MSPPDGGLFYFQIIYSYTYVTNTLHALSASIS